MKFKSGDRVRHRVLGIGTVIKATNFSCDVAFDVDAYKNKIANILLEKVR